MRCILYSIAYEKKLEKWGEQKKWKFYKSIKKEKRILDFMDNFPKKSIIRIGACLKVENHVNSSAIFKLLAKELSTGTFRMGMAELRRND